MYPEQFMMFSCVDICRIMSKMSTKVQYLELQSRMYMSNSLVVSNDPYISQKREVRNFIPTLLVDLFETRVVVKSIKYEKKS